MSRRRKAVCTICSINYLHFARTLMDSVRVVHPDWDRYLLLCDRNTGVFDASKESFNVVELSEIPLPHPQAFCFRYTILELNTAVKPWFLTWLFARGYDQVVYLDPDIYVYEPMHEVTDALDADGLLVLTPHLTGRLDDDARPNEHDILKAGAYNLGFLALARHPALTPFLKWWQEKVEFACVVDFESGLFVDQRWVDLVPGMFGDTVILRHDGYNVAYWNLKHRKVTKKGGKFSVNGRPLVFFHFSGLDPTAPKSFSKHQDRFRLGTLGAARQLVKAYCETVIANGLDTCREWPYAFDRFADGTRIRDPMRRYYRQHLEEDDPFRGDPFDLGHEYFHKPWGTPAADGSIVTIYMRAVWEGRPDLQTFFPDLKGASRHDFIRWFAEDPAQESLRDDCCAALVLRSLDGPGRGTPAGRPQAASPDGIGRFRKLVKRMLPRRVKEAIKEAFLGGPGPTSHRRRLTRRLVRRLPRVLRRHVASQIHRRAPVQPSRPRPRPAVGVRRLTARGVRYLGFFEPELNVEGIPMAWIGSDAAVRIPSTPAGTLTIAGEYHAVYHTKAGGSPETLLRLSLDGKPLGEITLNGEGAFEEHLPFPGCASPGNATLTIDVSQSFIPSEIGIGADERNLSVRIARMALDDTVILDFSRPDTPFVPDADAAHDKTGINIIGYLRSELGLGESARLCTASAEAAAIDYALVDYNIGCSSRADDHRLSHAISGDNPHPVNLFHINADQMPVLYSHLGWHFFERHYNVGFWHWELPELPDEWLDSFSFLNEIWAPSRFVVETVSKKSPVPVVRMGHGISLSVSPRLGRKDMKLPDGKFLFLMMYDMHSFQGRKNPEAAVDAFTRAFPNPRDVVLVIKTMNTKTCPDEWNNHRCRDRA